jgi:hypothetical protein
VAKREDDLNQEFGAGAHPIAFAPAVNAFPVVHRAEDGKGDHDAIGKRTERPTPLVVTPIKRTALSNSAQQQHRQDEHHAAHGGRAHLDAMRIRLLHTDDLADLEVTQDAQERSAPDDRHDEGETREAEGKAISLTSAPPARQ